MPTTQINISMKMFNKTNNNLLQKKVVLLIHIVLEVEPEQTSYKDNNFLKSLEYNSPIWMEAASYHHFKRYIQISKMVCIQVKQTTEAEWLEVVEDLVWDILVVLLKETLILILL